MGTSLYSAQASSNAAKVYDQAHPPLSAGAPAGSTGSINAPSGVAAGAYPGYAAPYAPRTVVVQHDSTPGFFTGLAIGSLLSGHHDTVVNGPGAYGAGTLPNTSYAASSGSSSSEGHSGFWVFLVIVILIVAVVAFIKLQSSSPGGTPRHPGTSKKNYEL